MPDWIRVGPQYGQINELTRPFVNTAAMASQDTTRFGPGGFWVADGWKPVPSGPGSAIASWSITASPGLHTQDASGFYNVMSQPGESRQWQIYNATTTPPSLIVAVATIALPYTATGMMVFELVGGATFAAFPVVPEFAAFPQPAQVLVASANGSVIGSAVPAAGSAAIYEMSRAYLHAPVPTSSMALNDETLFAQYRYVGIQMRAVGTVASGAMLRIQYMRLSVLPVPWIGTNAGPLATTAFAQASSLVGTWYSQNDRGVHVGPWGISRLARYPAVATIDAQQPNGAAFEIGSTIIAGQAQWGSDLVQKNYAQSLLSPGDPLAFERIPNRAIVFPYINRSPSMNSHLFQREMDRAIRPGNVIDVIPEDAQITQVGTPPLPFRRFDIVDGRVVNNEDLRYQRAGLARGEMQFTTLPYPRAASYVLIPITTPGSLPGNVYMPGDVPAAAYYFFGNNNQVASGPTSNTFLNGFMSVFVPSVATYLPITAAATGLGNSIASMPNGFMAAGSQINFGIANTGALSVARGWIPPGQQEAVAGRIRAFAVVANASSATIPLQLALQTGGNTNVATAFSNYGFSRPLNVLASGVLASEMRQLALVDLGEVRLPVDAAAMSATVQWDLYTASAASSNATAGVFDSVIFLPIGDPKGWFGVITQNKFSAVYVVTASNALFYDQTLGLGQAGAGQAFIPYITRTNVFDQTAQFQGRSPYLPPGQSWVFTVPIGLSGASGLQRPMVGGSAGLRNGGAAIYAYPRFLFLQ